MTQVIKVGQEDKDNVNVMCSYLLFISIILENLGVDHFLLFMLAASTDELWIGLNDRKTEGLFDWIDHSTVSFTSWEFGKPVVTTQIKDCVLIRGEVRKTI